MKKRLNKEAVDNPKKNINAILGASKYDYKEPNRTFNDWDTIEQQIIKGGLINTVKSVNGKIGDVVLKAEDINANNAQTIQDNLERIDGRIDDLPQMIFDIIRPVHSKFIQYGDDDNPNTLFNTGDITSVWEAWSLNGDYIRLDSNNPGTKVDEELPDHQHKIRSSYGSVGDAYQFEYTHPRASAWTDGKGEVAYVSTDYPNSVYKENGKVQPKGYTAVLWERIS